MSERKYLYLTTRGRKTGQPREIEIWFVAHGGCYYIVSEKREAAHWVRNIRAQAAISFHFGGETHQGSASIPKDPALIAAVQAKMDAKYGWSDGLVVELRRGRSTPP